MAQPGLLQEFKIACRMPLQCARPGSPRPDQKMLSQSHDAVLRIELAGLAVWLSPWRVSRTGIRKQDGLLIPRPPLKRQQQYQQCVMDWLGSLELEPHTRATSRSQAETRIYPKIGAKKLSDFKGTDADRFLRDVAKVLSKSTAAIPRVVADASRPVCVWRLLTFNR